MLQDVDLHLVESFGDAARLLEWLEQPRELLAFDTETTGLSPETDRVRLFQVGDAHHGWVIPMDDWKGLVREVVNRWDGWWVGWNSRFDVAMCRTAGIDLPFHRIHDGRNAAHITDPTKSVALKQQSRIHVDPRAAAMQSQLDAIMRQGHWDWETVPLVAEGPVSVYWVYAALDPVLTMRAFEYHRPTIEVEAPRAYDLELNIGWLADRMERKGVLVDLEYASQQSTRFGEMYQELETKAQKDWGVALGSADQVTRKLVAEGVDLWKRTDGGALSLDRDALAGIDHPLVHLLQRRKRVEKFNSTYLRRFIEYADEHGRLHPRINTIGGSGKSGAESGGVTGVKTARMSMERPNLQQLPRVDRDDELTTVVRNCIIAKPGHTLVMCDFDQVELRIMAHLSGDVGLAEAFAAGGDFFTTLTRKIYRDESITKSDPRRSLTKSYVYATLYGAGNDKLASTTGVPLSEVEQLSNDFAAAYAGVPAFQRLIQRLAKERLDAEGVPYVRSPLTNRRFIGEQGKEYKLVNFLIQGMAAEIMKTKALELDCAGLGHYMVLFVHDEVILEVPTDEVDRVAQVLNSVMNDDTMLSIPLTAGISVGERWGEKRDYELAS